MASIGYIHLKPSSRKLSIALESTKEKTYRPYLVKEPSLSETRTHFGCEYIGGRYITMYIFIW